VLGADDDVNDFESIRERRGYHETGPQFVTILTRQRGHANDRFQNDGTNLFNDLLDHLDKPD
jgi:hypothetical protein